MTTRAGWEMLPRGMIVALGLVCLLLAIPAAGLAALGLVGVVGGLAGAGGSVVPSLFAALLAGLFAWALGAAAWRMLRAPPAP